MDRVRFMPGWSVVYGQGSTFVSCQGGLWSMGSVRFMTGLSLVYRQGSFHARVVYGQCHARVVYGQCHVMPVWSMGKVSMSCQGGLWAVSFHARVVSGLRAEFTLCQVRIQAILLPSCSVHLQQFEDSNTF